MKHVATPFLDEGTPEFDENDLSNSEVGILGDIASAVLMKILYAARMRRYDLLRPVGALASRVTKWTAVRQASSSIGCIFKKFS